MRSWVRVISSVVMSAVFLTTAELRERLSDVAPATLYRQVAALVEGNVLEVVDERRIRGAVERTYRLRTEAATIDADEAREMSVEDHRQGFLTFVVGLLADFDRYLDGGDADLGRDLVGYRQTAFHLTDEETMALIADLRAVVMSRADHEPAPGRRRRSFTTILMPTDHQANRMSSDRAAPTIEL
jgi:hypothetical protein